MSIIQAELHNADETRPTVFPEPVRWLVALILVMGPLLQAIEFLLESGMDNNAARVAFWSDFSDRTGLSMTSGFLAIPFLLGGMAILVALTRTQSRRLAWLAGTFMTFGMMGLAAVHGYELAAFRFVLAGDPAGAISVLNGDNLGLPGTVLFIMFLGGAVLGSLTLSVAMWRSPYVPRIVVLFTLAFAVLDFAAGQGVVSHLVNLVGFVILAIAVLRGYSRSSPQAIAPATQPGS